eukprot:PLAT3821.1.p1 GENE.PLAT3821.1~~PLAT3821.1.p1  ORF type:complete len:636 (-),score=234.94 PLAT3821.1:133-2040(-)
MASQEEVYAAVSDAPQAVLSGFNATVFAYGQTGSGKTFTMFGPETARGSLWDARTLAATAGLVPRAVRDIFEGIRTAEEDVEFSVFVSFVQLYNERLYDLLRDPRRDVPLSIHEDRQQGVYVDGLSEFEVRDAGDCLRLLKRGEENRAVRHTYMNQYSSRSHSIFMLLVEQRRSGSKLVRGRLNLVDLAGSEKWQLGASMEAAHVSELTSINKSLHTLGRCITALSKRRSHVPFRDSKLTRLLQDSLGGNTKTYLLAALSCSQLCADESVSTLKFADCAKQVMATVRVNETRVVDKVQLSRLERENAELRRLLAAVEAGDKKGLLALEKELAQLRASNAQLRKQLAELQAAAASGSGGGGGGGGGMAGAAAGRGGGAVYPPAAVGSEDVKQLQAVAQSLFSAVKRFLAFDIEEEQLSRLVEVEKERFAAVASRPRPPLSASAPPPAAAGRLPRRPLRGASPIAPRSTSPIAGKMLSPPASAPAGSTSISSAAMFKSSRRTKFLSLLRDSHAEEQPDMVFRVRGRGAKTKKVRKVDTRQQRAAKEMRQAMARVKKQKKIQDFLRQKAARELEMLEEEERAREAEEKARRARDKRWAKQAAKTRKRLGAYKKKLAEDMVAVSISSSSAAAEGDDDRD